ncbi:hypothetical protein BpHYR1_011963 [Brachionus plicatilis]|uniref:Uncharacterized protein n=1 Tax=Brachionus plicatilis TaxID=10195 RepID=A0A3M7PTS9_BRAPC|nr:hypothetical protein BpHYR1_011963 [Brachionus plicatilis]
MIKRKKHNPSPRYLYFNYWVLIGSVFVSVLISDLCSFDVTLEFFLNYEQCFKKLVKAPAYSSDLIPIEMLLSVIIT